MSFNSFFSKKKYYTYEFCPRCEANLTLQKGYSNELPYWLCKGCNEMLINPEVKSESDIVWVCDKCDSMLNIQPGFSQSLDEWCCNKCGYLNTINSNEIYLSNDDYNESLNNPYRKMNISDVITLMDYMEVCKIDGHDNIAIVRSEQDGNLYIRKELTTYDTKVYRCIKEAGIRHIPAIIQICESDNHLVVIEEYIDGKTIEELLHDGPFDEQTALTITYQLMMIIKELHDLEPAIIHRDIKPSNVILDENKEVYLLDINAAKSYKEEEGEDTRLLGTHSFAAPEQYGCGLKASSPKTDIYGVGVMLNVMRNGKLPNEELASGVAGDIIKKCISLNPNDRYTDAELINLLEKLINISSK